MPRRSRAFLAAAAWACIQAATAQTILPDHPDWAEAEVPPPPASFDLGKLVPVDVDPNGSLRYGVDAASLSIGKDGIVRYVMVAQSRGAMTAMYEGLRCSTAEYKVYARYNAGHWTPVAAPEWKSLRASSRVMYPLAFARQGGCDNAAPPTSVRNIVEDLRRTGLPDHYP